ncbi:MAG TPA: hypothetical protein VLH75_08340 [Longimicrobiales bacterium]|nr:hypothetical protein [Longimicrobiales bacterium]
MLDRPRGGAIGGLRLQLADVEFLLGKPLDVVEYSAFTARQRARSGNPFLSRILAEPKAMIKRGRPYEEIYDLMAMRVLLPRPGDSSQRAMAPLRPGGVA